MRSLVLIRGGGDLATGVALRLLRAGLCVVMTEIPLPMAVRRSVAFAEAIYDGQITVEQVTACRVDDPTDTSRILTILKNKQVPVIIDPDCLSASLLHPIAVVDGRMVKQAPSPIVHTPAIYIGLGPGFIAGGNCQAVIETRRGHYLGRVLWQGAPENDTGLPDGDPRRILRAGHDGILSTSMQIGEHVKVGQEIAKIDNRYPVLSPLAGVLRGLIHPGTNVKTGMKIGDVDPRDDPRLCQIVSDKALAIGGGVLEALLSDPEIRANLWN